MSDILPLLTIPLGLVVGWFLVHLWTRESRSNDDRSLLMPPLANGWTHSLTSIYEEQLANFKASSAERSQTNFCIDCGQAMISLRKQDGFDANTGLPNYTYERACADFDPTSKRLTFGTYCGKRATEDPLPNAHNHADPLDMHTTCPVCIDAMLLDHVIDDKQATKLYEAAGIRPLGDPGSIKQDTLTDLGRIYGSMTYKPMIPPPPPKS